jgi:hypothetical protein
MERNCQGLVIDLATPADKGQPSLVIEVGGRKYRILGHAVETSPREYVSGWTLPFTTGAPIRCVRCGKLVEDTYSTWSRIEAVTCRACRDCRTEGAIKPRCTYCGTPLVLLLPIVNPDGVWWVWVCGWHHTYIVTRSEEGIWT